MGDLSDMADIDRWLRCNNGKKRQDEIRAMLTGKTVSNVEFSNDVNAVLVTITFATGESIECFMPELMLDALKETYSAEIQEEYFRDYPDRRPKPDERSEDERETNGS